MILNGLRLLNRTLSGIVPELMALKTLDLAQILLLLLALPTGLDHSLALLALGFVTFVCQGKVLLVLCCS